MILNQNLAAQSFVEIYTVTAIMYLIPALLLVALERHLERRRILEWGMPDSRPSQMEME